MPFGFDTTASTAASTQTLLAATFILKLVLASYSWYSFVVVKDGLQQSRSDFVITKRTLIGPFNMDVQDFSLEIEAI